MFSLLYCPGDIEVGIDYSTSLIKIVPNLTLSLPHLHGHMIVSLVRREASHATNLPVSHMPSALWDGMGSLAMT